MAAIRRPLPGSVLCGRGAPGSSRPGAAGGACGRIVGRLEKPRA
ncbi:hypothetical protein PSMK_30090 [Phycisphaera mikurensis NBRC 102666]|uniref:Uncharacterized protein n=1 Tax=Phycisphaera mikurensis (strain NBRC 102666 / KCTC 22515 / FYK2301M01) TaxID=1142394 RepID=I0IIT0_PHYMF|nr:hypothetical protein PSMK_30090 [Phycisphaera mikurensis NBRC 102666]